MVVSCQRLSALSRQIADIDHITELKAQFRGYESLRRTVPRIQADSPSFRPLTCGNRIH
jgi:hypothetical protein